jgi:hypothetical protein
MMFFLIIVFCYLIVIQLINKKSRVIFSVVKRDKKCIENHFYNNFPVLETIPPIPIAIGSRTARPNEKLPSKTNCHQQLTNLNLLMV